MQNIDTLIHARWVIPVIPHSRVIDNGSVAIHQGKIVAVGPRQRLTSSYRAETVVERPQHALIPGLINAHTHAAMNLMRGLADDLPLMEWLEKHIWPAEGEHVSTDFVRDGSELAMAEMLRSGTTCFNDMYFFPETTAQAAENAGMRCSVGMIALEFPSAYAQNADEYLHKGLQLRDEYRSSALINTVFAPHAPYTVSDDTLQKITTLAAEMDLPIHMHLHETAHEVSESEKTEQKRPIQRLADLGLLSPSFIGVHMTQLNADDIALCQQYQLNVVHCPESNLKLASGFCPVANLLEHNINVALGTDGTASNNDLDMLGEMRTTALLAKGVSGNAAAVPASTALAMATINGAKALGLQDQIGSLENDKWADITCLDLGGLETQPLYNPISQIVYAAGRENVTDVWVAGRALLQNRTLTTLNLPALLKQAAVWREKIAKA